MRISDMPSSLVLSGEESVPIYDPNQAEVLQRNRRVNVDFFKGIQGERGFPGLSAYQIWLNLGHTGEEEDFINSINGTDGTNGINGADGKSAYQIWLDLGNSGNEQTFINSLKGKSAYQIWVDDGNTGTETDFINFLRGLQGYSAYQIWLQGGNTGTEEDFLESLFGKSAYQIWLDIGNTGTEQDFIDSLHGEDGNQGPQGVQGPQGLQGPTGPEGSLWYTGTTVPGGGIGAVDDFYLNVSNGDVYGPKTSGGWNGSVGNIRGPEGTIWYEGSSAPSNSLGIDNDFYLRTTTGDVYKKVSGDWGDPIGNITGPEGPQGDAGPQGEPAEAGSVWYANTTPPGGGVGIDNDFYLNTSNGDVYKKISGAWGDPIGNIKGPQGANGNGAPGSVWYTGTAAPSNGIGINGDLYLRTSNGDIYKKHSGIWGSPVGNIEGPAGPQGDPGLDGDAEDVPVASPTINGISRLATLEDIETATPGAVVVPAELLKWVIDNIAPGSATAWVNFDGSVYPVVIKASFNVESVDRVAEGVYDIYFATEMDNENYAWSGSTGGTFDYVIHTSNVPRRFLTGTGTLGGVPSIIKTTQTLRVYCREVSEYDIGNDADDISVIVHGGKSYSNPGTPGLSLGVSPGNTSNASANTYSSNRSIISGFTFTPGGGEGPYNYSVEHLTGAYTFTIAQSPANPVSGIFNISFESSATTGAVTDDLGTFEVTIIDQLGNSASQTVSVEHHYYSSGSGGGGGCVYIESYLGPHLQASGATIGDIVMGMNEETREFVPMEITYIRVPEEQPCIRVETRSGPSLIFSLSTPLTLEDTTIMADKLEIGMKLPVRIGEDTEPFWDEVVEIDYIGMREVQLISVNGHCYAAGQRLGMYIYTHNMSIQKH